jgi:hypothetical protein
MMKNNNERVFGKEESVINNLQSRLDLLTCKYFFSKTGEKKFSFRGKKIYN